MDVIQLKDVPTMLGSSELPHYDGATIQRLLDTAKEWHDQQVFGPHINRLLEGLPDTDVWVDSGQPLISGSQVVGQVSWMEDFTMFAIHPERNWDVDLPRAVAASEYDLTVNNALSYKGVNAVTQTALVYDPALGLPGKKKADIGRAVKSCGETAVTYGFPSLEQLGTSVKRWNRHAMSGDYFLWQWMWVRAAGQCIQVTGETFTAWLGFVDYGDYWIFTSYHADGDCNGIGTACLQHAIEKLARRKATPVILTVPMLPEQAKRHNVERYETYKRRFANAEYPVSFLAGRWKGEEAPYPPYYNAQLQEMIHV